MAGRQIIGGVNTLVQCCAGVNKRDRALILTDIHSPRHIPELFANAVTALGAEPIVVTITPATTGRC